MITVNGELLKARIKAKYRTVTAFARETGLSRVYVYRIINGETPSVERLAEFARLLDLTVDELIVDPKDQALAVVG